MKIFLAIVSFLLLLVVSNAAWAGEVSVIKIEGAAAKAEFKADTKRVALENALKGSVEGAVKEVMKSEDILENAELIEKRIYPNPMNYILNYRILSEGWITHFDMPEDSVEPEGIEGEAFEGEDGEAVEGVEGEDLDAVVEGVATDVEQDAVEESPVAEEEPLVVRRHRKGSLAESSFFTPTAEDIEEGIVDALGEGVSGGKLLYHLWIEARVDITRLKDDVKGFSDIEEVETSSVNIEILGVKDHKRFEELRNGLEGFEIIKELGYESFSSGRYVLRASVAGTGHDLYDRLKGSLGPDMVIIPGGAVRVIIKLEESSF